MKRFVGVLLCAGCIVLAVPGAAGPEPIERLDLMAALATPRVSLSDEVLIMLMGTALIGLAALVRRTC